MSSKPPLTNSRKIISILVAWLLFIGVDFIFHASILAPFWEADIPAIKPLENLAVLIPAGYFSFLLLTILIAFIFFNFFKTKAHTIEVVKFGLIIGLLFALSNLFGLYSYVTIPFKHLLLFNLVYLIEILVVTVSLYNVVFSDNLKKSIAMSFLTFLLLIITGIILQNVL